MAQDRPPTGRIGQALELLVREARELLERHPGGHLLNGRRETVDLRLSLPTRPDNGDLEKASDETQEALRQAVRSLLAHRLTYRPGRVFCLRCKSADCDHSSPSDSRQVFAGYGPTGLPRFLDFGQQLLELRDPRVGTLYQEPPGLVAVALPGRQLTSELLSAFRDRETGYRLRGQVSAGWYRLKNRLGRQDQVAVSLQLISSHAGGRRWRCGLNVVGVAPGGEPLETVYDTLREIPWAAVVRWGQEALGQIERSMNRRRTPRALLESRLEGLLNGMARRLQKGQRATERRTRHAETRRRQGERPTSKALADLAQARDDQVLCDGRRKTLVVLGERGRAHVFNPEGKLVTSIRYSPASIDRRRSNGTWRNATAAEILALRERVGDSATTTSDGDG